MKKTSLLLAFAFVALATISSCKCEKCKHASLADTKICKDDFDNNADFQDAVKQAEDWGYKCSPSN